jgi:dTMP kinase
MSQGVFITFEGIGGCGKSTQIKKVADAISQNGYEIVLTREPGGSPGAEEIRTLILSGDDDRWSAETEILLFNAARRDHLERVVWPSLQDGRIVLCDRFVDSTRVYQGVARSDLRGLVDRLHKEAISFEADLTFIIDITAEESLCRIETALRDEQDRFDEMGLAFQVALRNGYLALARESNRYVVINGHGCPEEVFERVWRVCKSCLPENNTTNT